MKRMFNLHRTVVSVRTAMLVLAGFSFGWALWLITLGGFDTTLLGLRIRSNDATRAFVLGALCLTAFKLAGGSFQLAGLVRSAHAGIVSFAHRPAAMALSIAALSAAIATAGSTRIAGGSDEYGYVSQAELWLGGDLRLPQPWAAQVPWPNGELTFTPLGYRPFVGSSQPAIVPTYSPGLPILLACAKLVAGQCAMFAVGPLLGALAIVVTFGIGRRLGSEVVGLIAAWFVAVSPVVIGSMTPLTDVPVMAAWAVSFYFLLGAHTWHPLAAGLMAGLAILIRPNLFPLAAPMAAWFFLRRDGLSASTRWWHAGSFVAGTIPGVAAVALINLQLYGSPATSGYGRFEDHFAAARMLPNLGRYMSWLIESHTPLALLGLGALVFPIRRIWPTVADRSIFIVIGAYLAALWTLYCAYFEFDSWGYLRFLLPGWPFLMLALAAVFAAAARVSWRPAPWIAGLLVVALGLWNVRFAAASGAFDQRQAARHDAAIGRLVRAHTPANSVVLTIQRSGSLR
jgi:Dolichyl-phosphate-mannose-protein mannosyltransferase